MLLAVVQALAYTSALAGDLVEGVPVVAVGGRSLLHATLHMLGNKLTIHAAIDADDSERLWALRIQEGPPTKDPALEALELLGDHLGAVIVQV